MKTNQRKRVVEAGSELPVFDAYLNGRPAYSVVGFNPMSALRVAAFQMAGAVVPVMQNTDAARGFLHYFDAAGERFSCTLTVRRRVDPSTN